ncbi:MAG: NADP-dependent malic enzyme [bacterium ADurb.Bin374]|nr:MAG: NADP-dependent malic enzyme [bacterium ADurb.Bin374]
MDSGVATRPIEDMAAYVEKLNQFVYKTSLFMRPVFAQAKKDIKRVVLAEGENERHPGADAPAFRFEVIGILGEAQRDEEGEKEAQQEDDPEHGPFHLRRRAHQGLVEIGGSDGPACVGDRRAKRQQSLAAFPGLQFDELGLSLCDGFSELRQVGRVLLDGELEEGAAGFDQLVSRMDQVSAFTGEQEGIPVAPQADRVEFVLDETAGDVDPDLPDGDPVALGVGMEDRELRDLEQFVGADGRQLLASGIQGGALADVGVAGQRMERHADPEQFRLEPERFLEPLGDVALGHVAGIDLFGEIGSRFAQAVDQTGDIRCGAIDVRPAVFQRFLPEPEKTAGIPGAVKKRLQHTAGGQDCEYPVKSFPDHPSPFSPMCAASTACAFAKPEGVHAGSLPWMLSHSNSSPK